MRILEQLIIEIKWRKSRKIQLLNRIRKLITKTSFSIRDTKLLSKLVNQQRRDGHIDLESILYYFPGKTVDLLCEHYNSKAVN
mmetsp:Transcript_3635/g.3379  ORF Transcript_3635/g.3379 Transcript_3635/m.3379 type:complete len:83 (-) Transcript_3635:21-269(-)